MRERGGERGGGGEREREGGGRHLETMLLQSCDESHSPNVHMSLMS